ncbi:hypothetical protein GW17_00030506 [Ensete ventricosum]|nr:hypothetical protein GW17_00030506 [Ensete ventricosum]
MAKSCGSARGTSKEITTTPFDLCSKPELPLPEETKQDPRRRRGRWQIPRAGTGQKPERPPGNQARRRHWGMSRRLGSRHRGVASQPRISQHPAFFRVKREEEEVVAVVKAPPHLSMYVRASV